MMVSVVDDVPLQQTHLLSRKVDDMHLVLDNVPKPLAQNSNVQGLEVPSSTNAKGSSRALKHRALVAKGIPKTIPIRKG